MCADLYVLPKEPLLLNTEPMAVGSFLAPLISDCETPLSPKPKATGCSGTDGRDAKISVAPFYHLELTLAQLHADRRYSRQE
jgi:hypothetical protein